MESSSNESPNPKWPQEISRNSTGKYSPWIDFKLARWQGFVRIWRLSLQTTACLKPGWRLGEVTPGCQTGQSSTCRLNSSPLFLLPYPPLLPGLFSPASPPLHLHLLHLPILIPLPLPKGKEVLWLGALLIRGVIPGRWWRRGKEEAVLLSLLK